MSTMTRRNLSTVLKDVANQEGVSLATVEADFHEAFDAYAGQVHTYEQMAERLAVRFDAPITKNHAYTYAKKYGKELAPKPAAPDVRQLQEQVAQLTMENERLRRAYETLHSYISASRASALDALQVASEYVI